jgi:UDP-N-acetylglucosamine acyltransferase
MRDERNNYIHPTAIIGENVVLGSNNYIGPYCIIGMPPEHKDHFHKDYCGVVIGDNNHFTGLVTIDAGTVGNTIIGNGCWFLKHSHIGHDAYISNEVVLACGAKVGGHAIIRSGCNIGLNASIHQRQVIADGCMIGANAFVSKTLKTEPNRKYAGVPAKDIGENIKK